MDSAFGRAPRTKPLLINITPLVDVTLLLLIFFMVTATFREMNAVKIQTPIAESGVTLPMSEYEIMISDGGDIYLDNAPVALDELQPILQRLMHDNPDAAIALRADKRVPYEQVVRVLDSVRLAGVDNITLPVIPRE